MASTAATTPIAMTERISRSRSSMRCATKGCSVPASSSSGSFGVVDMREADAGPAGAALVEFLRPVLCHACRAGQRPGAHTRAGLVPVRHGALLDAPLLLRMPVLGVHRHGLGQGGRRRGRGVLPLLLEIGCGGGHGFFHVARGRLHRLLHLAELLELHRAIDLRLHVVDVPLRLAQQGADGTRHARQLLGSDEDQRHGADHHHLFDAEVEHGLRRGQDLLRASTSIVVLSLPTGPCDAVTCEAGGTGVSGVLEPSRRPSLKPLTAPPRSCPMFFSFLVPNTSTTINSTINQCQMENEPMDHSYYCSDSSRAGEVHPERANKLNPSARDAARR